MTSKRDTSLQESMSLVAKEIQALTPHIHPPVPNPAPLGLFAFGLTTALLQVKHTRWGGSSDEDLQGTDALVLGFAVFFGGFLQVVAGISEIKRHNIFGYTAFLLYGGFWMAVGTTEIVSLLAPNAPPTNPKASEAMMILCGIYTYILWICTFKLNKTICSLFFLLGTTFMLLAGGVQNETVDKVGGYFGVVTAANAFWLAAAELINDILGEGKEIIPLGHWKRNRHRSSGGVQHPGMIHGVLHRSMLRKSRFGPRNTSSPTLVREDPESSPNSSETDVEEGLYVHRVSNPEEEK